MIGNELTEQDRIGVDKAIAAMVKNVAENPHELLTTKQLLTIAYMSQSSFFRAFRVVTGTTPRNYLLSLRLKLAAKLLLQHRDSIIANIGKRVGYQSLPAFHEAFQREHGMTPKQYRKKHDRREREVHNVQDGGE